MFNGYILISYMVVYKNIWEMLINRKNSLLSLKV